MQETKTELNPRVERASSLVASAAEVPTHGAQCGACKTSAAAHQAAAIGCGHGLRPGSE